MYPKLVFCRMIVNNKPITASMKQSGLVIGFLWFIGKFRQYSKNCKYVSLFKRLLAALAVIVALPL